MNVRKKAIVVFAALLMMVGLTVIGSASASAAPSVASHAQVVGGGAQPQSRLNCLNSGTKFTVNSSGTTDCFNGVQWVQLPDSVWAYASGQNTEIMYYRCQNYTQNSGCAAAGSTDACISPSSGTLGFGNGIDIVFVGVGDC